MNIIPRAEASKKGLKFYFTGKPCKRGHVSERYVANGRCMACAAEHYLENKDYVKARAAKYYVKNKEALAASQAKWQKENPEAVKASKAKYSAKNKEIIKARKAKWQKENPDAVKATNAKWQKENPMYMFVRKSLRRVQSNWKGGRRKSEKILGYTYEALQAHIEKQFLKGMSWENRAEWHIDHIIPVSEHLKNGVEDPKVINCLSNLRPIWADENLSKGSKVLTLL